jgi:hypothetical protein
MKKWILLCSLLFSILFISAQDRTGVWRGTMKIVSGDGKDLRYEPIRKLDPVTGNPIDFRQGNLYPRGRVIDSNVIPTRAKLEIVQSGNKIMAQLISYALDNRQITMYDFEGTPFGRDGFILKGKSTLINETMGVAPPFNLIGKFSDTNSIGYFKGRWLGQLSGTPLGYFAFEKTGEPFTINPELVHQFLNPKNEKQKDAFEKEKLPLATPLYDSLVTTSFAIDASIVDNGIADHDTLSIWLNGHLIEDNVVPDKKFYLFRAVLEEKEWNHLTIRCKSEGKIKGTGILLNLNTEEALLKYNLVMYAHDQVDWVIGRKPKKELVLKSDQ